MQTLIIASHNQGKVSEYKKLMTDWPFEVISLTDAGIIESIEETGKTFEENALLKAQYAFDQTGQIVLADDSGLEIDYLNKEPGVKSRRWKGYEMTDQELIDYALEKLQGVPMEQRTARLRVVMCLLKPNSKPIFVTGSIEGFITEKQELPIDDGYPFRAIFKVTELDKLYDELTHEEHELVNHRLKALQQLKTLI